MTIDLSRRCFLKCTAATALSSTMLLSLAQRLTAASATSPLFAGTKARVGKVYLGNTHPGWPADTVDLPADVQKFEAHLKKLEPALAEYDFIDAGLVTTDQEFAAAKEKFKDVDGILLIQLTMGIGGRLQSLFELEKPVTVFALPYTGHEWHTIAGWQRQGKLVESFPTSRHEDILVALRPLRAIHRLKEARILHINQSPADAAYCKAIREKFGTEITSLNLKDLQAAYQTADRT